MSKTLLMAFAAAALLSGGMFGNQAEAMTPSALGVARTDAGLVEQVHALCGNNGCVQVQTAGPRKHRTHP
jgi:hypothetical protein